MKNTELSFVELVALLSEGELEDGQIIESDIFGTNMMIGTGGEGTASLVWEYNPEKPVVITPNVLAGKYTLHSIYKEITIKEMFQALLLKSGEPIYYNVAALEDREKVKKYYPIETILELNESNVFNKVTLHEDVRFYKKMF